MITTAYSAATDSGAGIAELISLLSAASDPHAVLFFASPAHDGAKVSGALRERWPHAEVVGCTTAGEFTQSVTGTGGISAIALPAGVVRGAWAETAELGDGVSEGITAAIDRLEQRIGSPLRDLDPARWLGILLVDGLHGDEEAVNLELGRHAPMLSFVGGSAGDDQQFVSTRVFDNGWESSHGAVLLVLDVAVPFTILKTCSFTAGDARVTITRADLARRVVYEIDHEPALEVYSRVVGVPVEDLDVNVFLRHPLGLMVDGQPWIRSPKEISSDGAGLEFYAQLAEGTTVHRMDGGDLIADMRQALAEATADLGHAPSGALLFNCILRRLEMDADQLHERWLGVLGELPTAGFHTYGESWLSHMNQTCTGVVFG